MNPRPLLASLLTGILLTGCATFTEAELGLMQRSGVSPRVVTKMEDGHVLSPEDVVELTRRDVPDRYILREIDDAGVDYILSPGDFKKLKQAHVSAPVVDALVAASDEFASRYAAPRRDAYFADPYFADPYSDPYPFYDGYYGPRRYPRIGGSVGIGFTTGGRRHWQR